MNQSEATKKEIKTDNRSAIKTIFDKFANHKDVTLVYGEPITYEEKCIIPVAKMSSSFGSGNGKETKTKVSNETIQNQGEGGGGHFTVQPLGVYEMTTSHVRFKPVMDMKLIMICCTVLTLGMTLLLRKK